MKWTVSGIKFRTVHGAKSYTDLRIEALTSEGWRPVDMAMAFCLVDFFAENEDVLRQHRSYWRQNGQRYFLSKCVQAVRDGWRSVADEIARQRGAA